MAESGVRFVKLCNGEEFIAFVTRMDGENVVFDNPVVAMVKESADTVAGTSVQFVPWVAFSACREGIQIPECEVMIISEVESTLASNYCKIFGRIDTSTPELLVH